MTTLMASIVTCIVGCNTGAPDGQSLHLLTCDTETGAAQIVQTVKGVQGTTYFQLDAARRNLYSVIRDTRDGRNLSAAVRFAITDGRLGAMTRLADLPCEAPCHVALAPDGNRLSFAAYTSGTVATLGLMDTAPKTTVLENVGMGPRTDRQQKAFAHCTFYTLDGSRMGVCDLGTDHIFFYDPVTLARLDALTLATDPGDGPRHAFFRADGRVLFVVNELSSTVASWAFDGTAFTRIGKWPMVPPGTDPTTTKAAAIKLTADGKILMASNRGLDSIAFFAVKDDGSLAFINRAPLTGSFPRDFELMPGEKFMVVGHKMSNEIQVYAFDRTTCSLTPVHKPIAVWRPLCFKFL